MEPCCLVSFLPDAFSAKRRFARLLFARAWAHVRPGALTLGRLFARRPGRGRRPTARRTKFQNSPCTAPHLGIPGIHAIHISIRLPGPWDLDIPGVPGPGGKELKWTVGPGRKECYRHVCTGGKEFKWTAGTGRREFKRPVGIGRKKFKAPVGPGKKNVKE